MASQSATSSPRFQRLLKPVLPRSCRGMGSEGGNLPDSQITFGLPKYLSLHTCVNVLFLCTWSSCPRLWVNCMPLHPDHPGHFLDPSLNALNKMQRWYPQQSRRLLCALALGLFCDLFLRVSSVRSHENLRGWLVQPHHTFCSPQSNHRIMRSEVHFAAPVTYFMLASEPKRLAAHGMRLARTHENCLCCLNYRC